MATLIHIQNWLEQLEDNCIASPKWLPEKGVYEYESVTLEVVAFLKLVRAVQSIRSLQVLCEDGLFIDLCTIIRCITDCLNEIFFLLEEYPERSPTVEKFVTDFRETTIDGYLSSSTPYVQSKKIHNSRARFLSRLYTKEIQFIETQQIIKEIHKTYSGYIHSNYAHIMQAYSGKDRRFCLSGVPSRREKLKHAQLIDEMVESVAQTIAYMAQKFNFEPLVKEILK